MQNYTGKKILSEFLDFLKYKVDNDLMTMGEIDSMARSIEANMKVYGTIDDIANYYGVNPVTVRTTIHKKLIDKPKRRVFYPFHKFVKIVPEKWLKMRDKEQ